MDNGQSNKDLVVKGARRQRKHLVLLILGSLLVLIVSSCVCCNTLGARLPLIHCGKDIVYQQMIDATPLLEVEIPSDLDLTPWENPDVYIDAMGGGAFADVQRLDSPSAEFGRRVFAYWCETMSSKPGAVIYGGELDNQYCASYVREMRSSPDSLCLPVGYYDSYVFFQKGDVIIKIYERSWDNRESRGREQVIQQLAEELSEAASR